MHCKYVVCGTNWWSHGWHDHGDLGIAKKHKVLCLIIGIKWNLRVVDINKGTSRSHTVRQTSCQNIVKIFFLFQFIWVDSNEKTEAMESTSYPHCWLLFYLIWEHKGLLKPKTQQVGDGNKTMNKDRSHTSCLNFRVSLWRLNGLVVCKITKMWNKCQGVCMMLLHKWHLMRLTLHLCGFSPVCLRMCTTSIYWALNGFFSLLHASQ